MIFRFVHYEAKGIAHIEIMAAPKNAPLKKVGSMKLPEAQWTGFVLEIEREPRTGRIEIVER